MPEKRTPYKKPPKKYAPKGLTILYEDHEILVVNKTSGLLTIGSEGEREKTALFLLNNYVKKGNSRSKKRLFLVHRLEKETSGVLVFAKHEGVKRFLQTQWETFRKTFQAIVYGQLPVQKDYQVLREGTDVSLLEIPFFKGRENVIRSQLADQGYPIVGDTVFGSKTQDIKRLALHASSITLIHPLTKEELTFKADVPRYFKTLMKHYGASSESSSDFPVLRTKRLTLKRVTAKDKDHFLEIANATSKKLEESEVLETIQQLEDDFQARKAISWGLFYKKQLIGTCGYYRGFKDKIGEVGFVMRKHYRKSGFMTEALEAVVDFGIDQLGLEKVTAFTKDQNASAIRVLEKLHFQRTEDFYKEYRKYERGSQGERSS